MIIPLLSISTSVIIDERSEEYPGAVVYIVEVEPGDEYAYCVSSTLTRTDYRRARWVKRRHVAPYTRPTTTSSSRAVTLFTQYSKRSSDPSSASLSSPTRSLQVGDLVSIGTIIPFGIHQGYVTGVEQGAGGLVAIAASKDASAGVIDVWVSNRYVSRIETP